MSNNYKNLINKLKDANQENAFDVYVPSKGNSYKFLPLNVKQQKQVIKAAMDTSLNSVLFINTLNKIIYENALDKNIEFNMLDRSAIIIALRSNSLKTEYTLTDDDDTKIDINLTDQINKFKDIKFKAKLKCEFELAKIRVHCSIPTLKIDTEVNAKCVNKVKLDFNTKDDESISRALSEVFIYEIIKFIDHIEFVDGEDTVEVDFKGLNINDRCEIVENFPVDMNTKVIDFITEVRQFDVLFTEVKIGDDSYNIKIDPAFFSE